MTDLEAAIHFIFDHENVYAKGHWGDLNYVIPEDVDGDSGGLTKFGLDQASHPHLDIANLTPITAAAEYTKEWSDSHAAQMPWPVNLAYFDVWVNAGGSQAAKLLQRAVGSADDGVLGPNSMKALATKVASVGATSVAMDMCHLRDTFYVNLASQKARLAKFLDGWEARVQDLEQVVEKPIQST